MINLLPEKYKLRFSVEYRWRVVAVAMIFFDAVLVIGIILLVSIYLSSLDKTESATTQVQLVAQDKNLHANLVAETATLSATLKALTNTSSSAISFTTIMSIIGSAKTSAISITSISYSLNSANASTSAVTVGLVGSAATRDDLANFVSNLKNEKRISSVAIPISDYAADTDVPFTVTITAS